MPCDVRPAGSHVSVEILVREDAGLDSIKDAVEKTILRYGTIECGIQGFDMRIVANRDGKPEELAPGVTAVTHGE
jgi:hypothetical protein